MVSALIDYLRYRGNRGIYSPDSIAATGGKLATSKNFPSSCQYEPMDIFFMHTKGSILSWAVMYFTGPTIWSHVGSFVGDGLIIDATLSGVLEHPFADYLDGTSYIEVKRLSIGPEQRAKGKQFLRAVIGAGFNWAGVFRLLFLHLIGSERYRIGFAIDFAVLFSLLFLLLHRWPDLRHAVLLLAVLYFAAVAINVSIRRIFRGGRVTIEKPPVR